MAVFMYPELKATERDNIVNGTDADDNFMIIGDLYADDPYQNILRTGLGNDAIVIGGAMSSTGPGWGWLPGNGKEPQPVSISEPESVYYQKNNIIELGAGNNTVYINGGLKSDGGYNFIYEDHDGTDSQTSFNLGLITADGAGSNIIQYGRGTYDITVGDITSYGTSRNEISFKSHATDPNAALRDGSVEAHIQVASILANGGSNRIEMCALNDASITVNGDVASITAEHNLGNYHANVVNAKSFHGDSSLHIHGDVIMHGAEHGGSFGNYLTSYAHPNGIRDPEEMLTSTVVIEGQVYAKDSSIYDNMGYGNYIIASARGYAGATFNGGFENHNAHNRVLMQGASFDFHSGGRIISDEGLNDFIFWSNIDYVWPYDNGSMYATLEKGMEAYNNGLNQIQLRLLSYHGEEINRSIVINDYNGIALKAMDGGINRIMTDEIFREDNGVTEVSIIGDVIASNGGQNILDLRGGSDYINLYGSVGKGALEIDAGNGYDILTLKGASFAQFNEYYQDWLNDLHESDAINGMSFEAIRIDLGYVTQAALDSLGWLDEIVSTHNESYDEQIALELNVDRAGFRLSLDDLFSTERSDIFSGLDMGGDRANTLLIDGSLEDNGMDGSFLRVLGDNNDTVRLSDDWVQTQSNFIDDSGLAFNVYQNGTDELLIQSNLSIV